MNTVQTFEQFLTSSSVQISILGFLLNIIFTAALAFFLGAIS